ncbi:ATP-binding cassette domain-containing protein [Bacillus sp. FJAT-25509]|uniref:ATP-binding cassette domain-containing protein n=1 Tax=Bacillus sp. FJAT-25509 TaxID=1712029 RepID=UPI0009E88D0D|nr:ATP-binding cassette domain-containing protein [Bacillus sp. FJAT-25509]
MLKFVELKNDRKKVKEYSFGMKQRLGLALALIGDTKLLILDELFVGLDLIGVEKFREFIHRISKEKGVAILISSHQLSEIESMFERNLFISEQKLENYIDS